MPILIDTPDTDQWGAIPLQWVFATCDELDEIFDRDLPVSMGLLREVYFDMGLPPKAAAHEVGERMGWDREPSNLAMCWEALTLRHGHDGAPDDPDSPTGEVEGDSLQDRVADRGDAWLATLINSMGFDD